MNVLTKLCIVRIRRGPHNDFTILAGKAVLGAKHVAIQFLPRLKQYLIWQGNVLGHGRYEPQGLGCNAHGHEWKVREHDSKYTVLQVWFERLKRQTWSAKVLVQAKRGGGAWATLDELRKDCCRQRLSMPAVPMST